MKHSELKHKTMHAVLWAFIRTAGTGVITFGIFTVLARVLSPHQFGVFTLAILVVELSRIVSYGGLPNVVLRDKTEDWLLADTAFWANLALGCLSGLVIWFAAPYYADLVGEPDVVPFLRTLTVMMPFGGLCSIHSALKFRSFGHKTVAGRMLLTNLLAGISGIGAALNGMGVWSLVVHILVLDVVGMIGAWCAYPWMPRLRFSWSKLRAVMGFSGSMMLTDILAVMQSRAQDVVIARYVSVASVGTYRIAWRMLDLIAQMLIYPIVEVAVITLSKLQDDPERYRQAFLRMLGLGALAAFPAMTGFGVLADDFIVLLFGDKWATSAQLAKILSFMTIPFCLNYFVVQGLASKGHSAAITLIAIMQTSGSILVSLIAAMFGGLEWIAIGYVVRSYLMLPINHYLFHKHTGIGLLDIAKTLAPPFIADQIMLGLLWLLLPYLHENLGHGVIFLGAAASLGAVFYGLGLTIFSRDYVRSNVAALIPFFKAKAA